MNLRLSQWLRWPSEESGMCPVQAAEPGDIDTRPAFHNRSKENESWQVKV